MIASCSYHATMGLGFDSILVKQHNTYSKTTAQRGFLINTEGLNPDVADLPYTLMYNLYEYSHRVQCWAFLMCPPWLGCCVCLAGLVFLLSPQLVSHLPYDAVSASLVLSSCHLACLPSGLPWSSLSLVPDWARLLGLSPSLSLRSCLPSCLPTCRVHAPGLSPKFHVRFAQLFGVYGGVVFWQGSGIASALG